MEDLYLEGFAEGRRSMARSIALKLQGSLPDEELASLLGLDPEGLSALLAPLVAIPEEKPDGDGKADSAPFSATRPLPGHRLVEPAFVRIVRVARNLTQSELARILGVHPRTVCEWENAVHPCRIRTETYGRLSDLAASVTAPDRVRAEAVHGVSALPGKMTPELPLFPAATEPAAVASPAEAIPEEESMEAVAEPSSDELSDVPF
ncbi:MAG: helix-turn-helix transcriptional regulator [Kiritimatiellia bacterium]